MLVSASTRIKTNGFEQFEFSAGDLQAGGRGRV